MQVLAQHEGEGQMIQVQLEFTGESRRHLARLEREMPITFRAAHAKAAIHARNRLRKVVREFGGSYRVSKLAPRHEMTGLIAPWRKPFGRLAEKNSIVSFRQEQHRDWRKRCGGWLLDW